MTWAQQRVPEHWNAVAGDEDEAFRRFKPRVLTVYSWISGKNLKRLWTQGRYYAWKDGALARRRAGRSRRCWRTCFWTKSIGHWRSA